MKQAKASKEEAETLLRWLQEQKDAPPFNRTVFGYLLLLEHCCDPAKDYLDWKPGMSPAEVKALRDACQYALSAFNQIPNTRLPGGLHRDTYAVALAIEKALKPSAP